MTGVKMLTVREIDNLLKVVPLQSLHALLEQYRDDPRTGVRKLIEQYDKKLKAYKDELV